MMARWLLITAVALLPACGSRSDLTADELDGPLGGGAGTSDAPGGKCATCAGKINGTHHHGIRPTCPGEATERYEALLACGCRDETCQDACFVFQGKKKPGPMYELCGDDEHRHLKVGGCAKCLKEHCRDEWETCRPPKPDDP